MAEAVAEGVREVPNAEVIIKRVPETIPDGVLENMGAGLAQQQLADVPVADPNELGDYDAIIFGSPTRFGNMTGQMRTFLDQTRMDEITGGSPYGAATIVGQNDREPSDNELVGARFQCRHVAAIAAKLAKTEAPVAA
jgi:multimeric flavodoxin WrbA